MTRWAGISEVSSVGEVGLGARNRGRELASGVSHDIMTAAYLRVVWMARVQEDSVLSVCGQCGHNHLFALRHIEVMMRSQR